jgi:glutaredoxin 3
MRYAMRRVRIYTTPSCSYCTMAKNFMRQEKIPFTEIDVSKDQAKAEEMVRKSGQMGVPVLDIDGRILVGFKQTDIISAVKR